jgi:hypothetical protein
MSIFLFGFKRICAINYTLSEDDYNSIDGIVNNGDRRKTDPLREDTRANRKDQKTEAERESVMEKIREHEERLRNSALDPAYFRKDALSPDRELC